MDPQLLHLSKLVEYNDVYKNKLKVLRYFLLGKGWYRALKALEAGASIHTGLRKDKLTPEFQHQVEIALYITTILDGLLYPEDTIIAVILHDTPEDYPDQMSHDLVRKDFGDRAGLAVFRMDKNGKTKEAFFRDLSTDPIASIGKGGDRMHNIKTMPGVFGIIKQVQYKQEVREDFLPMLKSARRLFPEQTSAYENIKHIFTIQLELLDAVHEPQGIESNVPSAV